MHYPEWVFPFSPLSLSFLFFATHPIAFSSHGWILSNAFISFKSSRTIATTKTMQRHWGDRKVKDQSSVITTMIALCHPMPETWIATTKSKTTTMMTASTITTRWSFVKSHCMRLPSLTSPRHWTPIARAKAHALHISSTCSISKRIQVQPSKASCYHCPLQTTFSGTSNWASLSRARAPNTPAGSRRSGC